MHKLALSPVTLSQFWRALIAQPYNVQLEASIRIETLFMRMPPHPQALMSSGFVSETETMLQEFYMFSCFDPIGISHKFFFCVALIHRSACELQVMLMTSRIGSHSQMLVFQSFINLQESQQHRVVRICTGSGSSRDPISDRFWPFPFSPMKSGHKSHIQAWSNSHHLDQASPTPCL